MQQNFTPPNRTANRMATNCSPTFNCKWLLNKTFCVQNARCLRWVVLWHNHFWADIFKIVKTDKLNIITLKNIEHYDKISTHNGDLDPRICRALFYRNTFQGPWICTWWNNIKTSPKNTDGKMRSRMAVDVVNKCLLLRILGDVDVHKKD